MLIEFLAAALFTGINESVKNHSIDKYNQTHELPFWAKPDNGVNSFRGMSSKEMKEWLKK